MGVRREGNEESNEEHAIGMVIEILGLNSIGIISEHLRWPSHSGNNSWSGVTLIDGSVKL